MPLDWSLPENTLKIEICPRNGSDNVLKTSPAKGDIVSLFSPWGNSQTLANPTWKTGNWLWDTYNAHGVDNIKNQPIYIDDGMSSIPIDNSNQRRYLVPT